MCGIAGYFLRAGKFYQSLDVVRKMTSRLAHRGPNDHGVSCWHSRENGGQHRGSEVHDVALGHRRLSILDLSPAGHQPFLSSDGRVGLTYNGEVYNYRELRTELEKEGFHFSTNTDTEVVLQAYLAWDIDCFTRFNGMWALAIYDARKDQLIFSRDRFGKKPLYYYHGADRIIFGSECKALFECEEVSREPNLRKVSTYLGRHYRYVDSDQESFFARILQIPPGTWVSVDRNLVLKVQPYWQFAKNVDQLRPKLAAMDDAELEGHLIGHLEESVKLRLRSDVPVSVLLSGGLDSTTIAALVARQTGKVHTLSSVTGDGYFDESEFMNSVVEHIGADAQFIRPKHHELLPTLSRIIEQHDEPVSTASWYSFYLMTEELSKSGFPVVLTGHGGDELLAGYWDHYHYRFADLRESQTSDQKEVNFWISNHGRPLSEYDMRKNRISEWKKNPQVLIEDMSLRLDTVAISPGGQAIAGDLLRKAPETWSNLDRRLFVELHYETIPASLRTEDRNCMAFSIENRVPFLDYRVVEFCFALAGHQKIRNGLGKWLLRSATKDLLPEKVRWRKDKTGHNYPFDEWVRQNAREFSDIVQTNLVNCSSPWIVQSRFEALLREHCGGAGHGMYFWQALNLALWKRQVLR